MRSAAYVVSESLERLFRRLLPGLEDAERDASTILY